ncbi:PilW family protein [Nitrincola sp. MINF-07-Sa-05]|uniref:PilW family protein n=1 Tax=Nitrincola salilacus TaxID=3400273 RepID=UPI0039186268
MRTQYAPANYPPRARGFTILEVMIALTAGLLILLALTEVFTNNSRTRGELEKTNRQTENGRYAMTLLSNELSNAGFFAEAGEQIASGTLPDECDPSTSASNDDYIQNLFGYPIQGGNNITTAPTCLTDFKTGNDFIAIRRSSSCAVDSGSGCDAFLPNAYHLQVSACQTDDPGEIFSASTALISGMTATAKDCSTRAPVYRLFDRIYFITADNILSRAELGANTVYSVTPLVDGIEALHFEYGIDTDNNGEPDLFTSTPTAAQWPNAVAVRVWLIVRSLESSPGHLDSRSYVLGNETAITFNDSFKRQMYSTTVRINNVAGRREQP